MPRSTEPFIDPGYFGQPDFQFFAPAEVGDFGGEEPPNTGIYFDYDRTVRQRHAAGWRSLVRLGVPGRFHLGQPLGNRLHDRGAHGLAGDACGTSAARTSIRSFPGADRRLQRRRRSARRLVPIIADRNPRIFDVRTSLNVASFSSLELNKTWRRKEFHNGSVLEPLVGFRYMKFKDWVRRDDYERFRRRYRRASPIPVHAEPSTAPSSSSRRMWRCSRTA